MKAQTYTFGRRVTWLGRLAARHVDGWPGRISANCYRVTCGTPLRRITEEGTAFCRHARAVGYSPTPKTLWLMWRALRATRKAERDQRALRRAAAVVFPDQPEYDWSGVFEEVDE